MKSRISVLIAILLLAAAVRAYGAWAFPFEQDELYTVDEATNLFHTKLLPGIQARPVFFLLEHPVVVLLPHVPAILRARKANAEGHAVLVEFITSQEINFSHKR